MTRRLQKKLPVCESLPTFRGETSSRNKFCIVNAMVRYEIYTCHTLYIDFMYFLLVTVQQVAHTGGWCLASTGHDLFTFGHLATWLRWSKSGDPKRKHGLSTSGDGLFYGQ